MTSNFLVAITHANHPHVAIADLTESQHGLLRDPPWELRAKCLEALRAALHSGNGRLVTLGVQGLQVGYGIVLLSTLLYS